MTVTVQSVVDRVQATLQDTTGIRWPVTSELVLWVNDAQREIALLKPDATAVNTTVILASGTKQAIPATGNRLLDVVRNMSNTTGNNGVGKRAVRLVDRAILDSQSPSWHDPSVTGAAAHTSTVKHWVYNENNPREFYVYPGVSGNAYLEIIYSANPTTVALSDNLGVPDIFANTVMNYVLYMAYMKDSEYAGAQQRAASHYQLFLTSISGKGQLDNASNPNSQLMGA